MFLGNVHVVNRGQMRIGNAGRIVGSNRLNPIGYCAQCNLICEKGAVMEIGNHLGMSNSTIYSRRRIVIGDYVLIGGGTRIYDTDFHSIDHRIRCSTDDKKSSACAPVEIGNHVFIGAGSTILKGCSIGDRAVIGANSVVTKNVPPDEIWAGNPAVFIKKNKYTQ